MNPAILSEICNAVERQKSFDLKRWVERFLSFWFPPKFPSISQQELRDHWLPKAVVYKLEPALLPGYDAAIAAEIENRRKQRTFYANRNVNNRTAHV
jgi:hypothetical protein